MTKRGPEFRSGVMGSVSSFPFGASLENLSQIILKCTWQDRKQSPNHRTTRSRNSTQGIMLDDWRPHTKQRLSHSLVKSGPGCPLGMRAGDHEILKDWQSSKAPKVPHSPGTPTPQEVLQTRTLLSQGKGSRLIHLQVPHT